MGKRYLGFNLEKFLDQSSQVLGKSGREYVLRCLCDARDSDHGHLWVNVIKQVGVCYRCGRAYDLVDIIQVVANVTLREALAIIRAGSKSSTRLQQAIRDLQPEEDHEIQERDISLPDEYQPVRKNVPPYLAARGLDLQDCKRWGIGTCSKGFYRNRVIIPVFNYRGLLVSFIARYMGDPPEGSRKVLYPKGSKISSVLFDEGRAWNHRTPAIVVEGAFDAMIVSRAGQYGKRWSGVALCGKHASPKQFSKLVSWGQLRPVIVALDADALADSRELSAELSALGVRVSIVEYPENIKDFGDLSFDVATARCLIYKAILDARKPLGLWPRKLEISL